MRKVYLIVALALIGGLSGLVLWYQHVGAPNPTIAKLIPGTTVRNEQTVTFAVISDNEGDNPDYRDLIKQIVADKDVQFLLHLGDATNRGGNTELKALQTLHSELGLIIPVYAVPGNHDIKDDANRLAFQNAFGKLPRSIDIQNLHLVLLDNADRKVGFTSSELDWLKKDLADSPSRRLADSVTILAYHRPFAYPLAELFGDDETRTSRKTNDRFLAILAQNPVQQVFTGHIHTAFDFAMVTQSDATNRAVQTVPVTISGGGGQPIQSAFGGLVKENFHWLKVTVTGQEIQTELKPSRAPAETDA
ncbi:MAG: metallophosphoesterase [bacterium]|nr:metallophosphoesterase [bacterium]